MIKAHVILCYFFPSSSFPFPASVMYNLDEDESQGGIAINLLPLLAEDFQHKGEQWSPPQDKGKKWALQVSAWPTLGWLTASPLLGKTLCHRWCSIQAAFIGLQLSESATWCHIFKDEFCVEP